MVLESAYHVESRLLGAVPSFDSLEEFGRNQRVAQPLLLERRVVKVFCSLYRTTSGSVWTNDRVG